MILRYDPVLSKLTIDDGRGTLMSMTGTEADLIGEALDHVADHPEEWHQARRESVLALERKSN